MTSFVTAVLLGRYTMIGASPTLYTSDPERPFFRIDEIHSARSLTPTRLAVSCDIRDKCGDREVKLVKNTARVLAEGYYVDVAPSHNLVSVFRPDKSLVLRVKQLDTQEVVEVIEKNHGWMQRSDSALFDKIVSHAKEVQAGIQVTGSFHADGLRFDISDDQMTVGSNVFSGSTHIGGGGIRVSKDGITV